MFLTEMRKTAKYKMDFDWYQFSPVLASPVNHPASLTWQVQSSD